MERVRIAWSSGGLDQRGECGLLIGPCNTISASPPSVTRRVFQRANRAPFVRGRQRLCCGGTEDAKMTP